MMHNTVHLHARHGIMWIKKRNCLQGLKDWWLHLKEMHWLYVQALILSWWLLLKFLSAEAAGPDGLRKSKSDSKVIASVLAPPKDVVDLQVEGYGNVNIFTYDELRAATKNFRPDQILGEGGFGVVYKGVIDENVRAGFPSRQVAVKELNPEGFQGDKEWLVSIIVLFLFLILSLVMYIEKSSFWFLAHVKSSWG